MNLTVTDAAAKEVRHIISEQKMPDTVRLRVRVVGGGCSGYQTKLDLDENTNEKLDVLFDSNGVACVVDKRSALYLDGAIIDWQDDLNKRGFKVSNPNAKTTCGCGSSWST